MPRFEPLDDSALRSLSPLQLAYIGDSVFDLMVRGRALRSGKRLHHMHLIASAQVNATAQARTLERLMPHLTETEADMVRRGRNAHARHQAPKSASQADYAASTGFEALLGMLYVTGQEARLESLLDLAVQEEAPSP